MSLSAVSSNFCEASRPPLFPQQSKLAGIQVSACCSTRLYGQKSGFGLKIQRHCLKATVSRPCLRQSLCVTKCAMDASFGGKYGDLSGASPVFPRINIKDSYKRLGISREASEEEIQAARNFLIEKYAGHKPSVDAIESAYDKILLESFRARRRPKINLKGKWRKVTDSRLIKAISSRFEAPSRNLIIKTATLFLVLGIWSFLNPTEEGPVYQVAISLMASIYFIYSRLKNRLRACLYGLGAFVGSWVLGSFLMASVLPPVIKGARSLEVTTSLISYVFLWIASTYLK